MHVTIKAISVPLSLSLCMEEPAHERLMERLASILKSSLQ
jgi:hypothetical protein